MAAQFFHSRFRAVRTKSAPNSGEKIESVLEVLAHTEETTTIMTRLTDGKFSVRSKSWDENKVILPDQVLELRVVSSRMLVARKEKQRDSGDPCGQVEATGYEGEITEFAQRAARPSCRRRMLRLRR